ncbi:aspartic peptidase domain-containing protein [Stachybotrys elegans]|uniref:Aspartic peptidase domain-containing protein n=1 Tax=Stachybotrys elegans TaxID=80388 RepID=A0A8K0WVV0_9HYPO|nr:aspartic peptidase domain-containing protein [Stachybotrys elegans]
MFLSLLVAAVFAAVVRADGPAPVALESGGWLGIDGNWSSVRFDVGSPSQEINVLISTSLSEFWTIGPGGCVRDDQQCITRRGGIYVPEHSPTWKPLDFWELGLKYLGFGGNGEYGLDAISASSPITNSVFSMKNVLLASINTTDYFEGLFGLGIIQSSFGNRVAESPLTQAVKTYGQIPSYSYGYTAGAHYRNTPASVTLGGYDTSRFVSHNERFTLTRTDGSPRVNVRGIQVAAANEETKPDDWTSLTNTLSSFNDSFLALIDSTTPHIWLPGPVCDRFAQALNLTYNNTLDIYTITDDQYAQYMEADSFTFTFSLSSPDNTDHLGSPLTVPGVVNITLDSRAFVTLLQYPFKQQVLNYGDPAVPSFSLRRAPGNSTFILGRTFLQEAYLTTRYDEQAFSIYQARFPDNYIANANIEAIQQPANSPYPPPAAASIEPVGLTDAQKAGIAVGVILGVSLAMLALWWWWLFPRWRKSRRASPQNDAFGGETKDSASVDMMSTPISPFIRTPSQANSERPPTTSPDSNRDATPTPPIMLQEAPDTEIHELPAALPPTELPSDSQAQLGARPRVVVPPPAVELDASDEYGSTITIEDMEMSSSESLSPYELSKRKLEKQLQGPLPEYSPPESGFEPPPEKLYPFAPREEPRPVPQPTQRRAPEPLSLPAEPSPVMVATAYPEIDDGTFSMMPLPSPLSPHPSHMGHPSSPSSESDTLLSAQSHPTYLSSMPSFTEQHMSPPPPPPTDLTSLLPPTPTRARRSHIDPADVVRVGPLQVNAQLSRQSFVPQFNQQPHELSLRSNRSTWMPEPLSPRSMERIDMEEDLIHVPQLAPRRFSWEEERETGSSSTRGPQWR